VFNAHRPFRVYSKDSFSRISVADCLEGAKFDPRKVLTFVIFKIQNRNIRRTPGNRVRFTQR
jgi:hypothetical protein